MRCLGAVPRSYLNYGIGETAGLRWILIGMLAGLLTGARCASSSPGCPPPPIA